jgi:hypothetical protein
MFKISGAKATVWQKHVIKTPWQQDMQLRNWHKSHTKKAHTGITTSWGVRQNCAHCCIAWPVQHSEWNLMSVTSARLNYETYALWLLHDLSRTASQTTLFANISSVQHKKSYNSTDELSHQFATNENKWQTSNLTKKSVKIPNIKFHENPLSVNRTVACGLTWLS